MSKGSMQRGNSEYNSWAGGGDLLCPTHVLIFYCFVCILQRYFELSETFRGCLVSDFKPPFSVFKQHFTHFNALFHPHIFPQIFLNNNFQFLNTHTKRAHNIVKEYNLSLFNLYALEF